MKFQIKPPLSQDPNERFIFDNGIVENFKACFSVGDNFIQITPSGSTDYTTVIDNAIGQLSAGGTLYFPTGTFPATVITVDQEIKVEGPGTIQQKASGATADTPFINVTADNVWFDGVTIDGNKANQGVVTGAHLLRFANGADGCKVTNCDLKNSTGNCIFTQSADNLEIRGNRFSNYREGNYAGIYIQTVSGGNAEATTIRITDNYVDGATSDSSCIKVAGNSTYPIRDVVISGNQCIVGDPNADTIGIELWSGAGTGIYDAVVTGNTVKAENNTNDRVWGISSAGAGTENVSITGNTIRNCQTYGIEVGSGNRVSVTGNTIYLDGTPTLTTPGIILINSNKCVVSANTIKGYKYGIQVYTGTASATAADNVVANNVVVLATSLAGNGIFFQCNNASATLKTNMINCNIVVGDGTADQYGIALQLDSGTFTDNYVVSNILRNLVNGISRDSEANTYLLNNSFETVTTDFAGTAGSGEVLINDLPSNGTFAIDVGKGLVVNDYIYHDYAGSGAALTGFLRLKQNDYIMFRNEAGDGDIAGLSKKDSNIVVVGDTTGIGVLSPTYIGDGAAGNVQAPAKGTGTGPTTAGTVVKFIAIDVSGATYYIPLMQ
jgi:parallel beta-helix repeat protein